jgi:hypothetical protein
MTDLSMTRGNTALFDTTVHFLQAGGLTGYSAWFTAKRDAADPDAGAVFQKQIGSGMSAGSPVAGTGAYAGFYDAVLTTTVVPANTESLPTGYAHTLVWDVKVKDGSGIETTVDSGTLTVLADVTQAV